MVFEANPIAKGSLLRKASAQTAMSTSLTHTWEVTVITSKLNTHLSYLEVVYWAVFYIIFMRRFILSVKQLLCLDCCKNNYNPISVYYRLTNLRKI